MIKNYLTIALRNFWRNKVFSSINVLGLSIGISASLVIFLIAYYEFSFDKFEKDNNRIYRVVMDMKFNGDIGYSAAVPAPLSNAIKNEVSGVEETIPVMQFEGDAGAKVTVANNSNKTDVYKKQTDIVFTNDQYFNLIPHQFIAGAKQSSLQNPFSVVLTKSRAQQYFPGIAFENIIGKQITYNDELKTTVTGIVNDLNEHTDFTAVEFISFPTISQTHLQDNFMMNVWNDWMAYSKLYIKLSEGNTVAKTETQLKNLIKKYNKDANKDDKNSMAFRLQPLSDMHFNTNYASFGQRIAHKPTLYSLLAVAAFLLLLGCINFINLTTAQASQRAKEIGIRKTIGSSRKQLILQFLSETFFITLIATLASILITPLLLKMFADFIPQGLHFDLLHQPALILFLVLLTIVVSFLSGLYPALILSAHKPVSILKNQLSANAGQTRNAWVRKTLTVSQFVIAQFFIIGTFMVSKQIHYTLNTDLGFKKEAIINFEIPHDTIKTHSIQLLNEIKSLPEVQLASIGFMPPAMQGAAFSNIKYNDGKKDIEVNVQVRWGDSDYIKVYQIKLLAGRNVGQGDSVKEYLVNETYAKALGFQHPQDAIGKQLTTSNGKYIPIVGVMQDFHQQSLHGLIGPLVFQSNNDASFFHIKLKPQNAEGTVWQNAIAKLTLAYKKMYPAEDFNYSFFDESIAKFYTSEEQTSRLLKWATGLAILISCLGLLGLVIYTTNVRTKEIGVRKILGASVSNIISILSKDFVRLLIFAFLIAAPIAWWASDKWLQNFAYRTTLSWWVFALSGLAMMVAALITLSIQIIKAATVNPVKSLRSE